MKRSQNEKKNNKVVYTATLVSGRGSDVRFQSGKKSKKIQRRWRIAVP